MERVKRAVKLSGGAGEERSSLCMATKLTLWLLLGVFQALELVIRETRNRALRQKHAESFLSAARFWLELAYAPSWAMANPEVH